MSEYSEHLDRRNARALRAGQARWDNMSPPDDDPEITLVCKRCKDEFQTDNPKAALCDQCKAESEPKETDT